MDFDAEDVEKLDTRKRDQRQPTGADAAGVLALWQKSRAKRIVDTTAIPLDCSRCLHSFAQIRPSTKATSGTRSDAQTSGGLLIVGELPGHPVIGHTVPGRGIEVR